MIDLIISIFFVSTLAIWYILSIVRYMPNCEEWITKIDTLFLIPQWKFFAPNPNETDYFLYYRIFIGDQISPWRIVTFGKERKWFAFFWNPYRRNRKAFFDLCQSLFLHKESSKNSILFSLPYLLILNYITSLDIFQLGDNIQFAIAGNNPSTNPQELELGFISDLHKI